MRSMWELERTVDNNNTVLTNSLNTLDTKVGSMEGVQIGSNALRVLNVASVSGTIPSAGTVHFDTTRKAALFSDGTSFFLATGSLA